MAPSARSASQWAKQRTRRGSLARPGAVLAAVALALLSAAPAATARTGLDYVALGDSAAAGPLIPHQDPNLACLRSSADYPGVAAAALGAKLTDVTCSGAKTTDLTGHQHGFLAPQLDALKKGTDLVSLTIGGNDARLVQTATSCLNLLPEPVGRSCADRYTGDGDEVAERVDAVGPKVGAALEAIRAKAPRAEVVVVGYGTYLRPGGCYPKQPLWARDADYVQRNVDRLSAVLREQAVRHGARFVDAAAISAGHDTCAAVPEKYFEGLVPTSAAAPLHPNAHGMRAFGTAVADAVRGSSAPDAS